MDIEDRINQYHADVAGSFIEDLLAPKKIPEMRSERTYRLKDDAKVDLVEKIKKDGVDFSGTDSYKFSNILYTEINKIPMKQFGYGMLNGQLPEAVAKELTPWEALYAYAGIWALKSYDYAWHQFERTAENKTLYQITRMLILRGVDRIKFIHNREVEKGTYKDRMTRAPHEQELRKKWYEPKVRDVQTLNPKQHKLEL